MNGKTVGRSHASSADCGAQKKIRGKEETTGLARGLPTDWSRYC